MTRESCVILAGRIDKPEEEWITGLNVDVLTWQMRIEGFGELTLPEESKSIINQETLYSIKQLASRDIGDDKLIARLRYNGFNTWFYHRFNIYFELREVYYLIRALEKLRSKYERILVLSNDSLLKRAFESDTKVKVQNVPSRSIPKKNWIGTYLQLSVYGTRLLRAFLKRPKSGVKLIVSGPSDMRSKMTKNDILGSYNPLIGPLFRHSNPLLTEMSLFELRSSSNSDSSQDRERLRKTNIEGSHYGEKWLFKILFSTGTWSQLKEIEKRIESVNEDLSKERADLFSSLYWTCFYRRKKLTKLHFLQYLAYSRFFKNKGIEAALISNEYGPNQRAFIDAAHSNGVTTLGIQHGAFHSLHPGYTYSEQELVDRPFPDIFLSWGSKWSRLFDELNPHHSSEIVETGIVRMDEVVNREYPERADIFPYAELDESIALFATQPQRDENLRRRAAEEVFSMAKDIKGLRLFLKLHPREKDVDYYRAIGREVGCDNYEILTGNTDLYSCIHYSDVVITCFSTVGTEAVLMGRPLVVIDHLGQDVQGYIKEGVGFEARNFQMLKDIIVSILDGEQVIDTEAYQAFIISNATSMDGEASKRAIDVLMSQ